MRRVIFFLFSTTAFLPLFSQSPNWLWARNAGQGVSTTATSVASDASGNCYVFGTFCCQSVVFGTDTLHNRGNNDVFLAKYDANGNVLWGRSTAGPGFSPELASSVVVDANGDILVTGITGNSPIIFGQDTLYSNGTGYFSFVAKYDAGGNVVWAAGAGVNGGDVRANGTTTDATGNVYVTGSFNGPMLLLGTDTLINGDLQGNHTTDVFLVKYDPNGNTLWAKSAGSVNDEEGIAVSVDPTGNLLLCGTFQGPVIFDSVTLTCYGAYDAFVAKFDANGNTLWAKNPGGNNFDAAKTIATDASGNIFFGGFTQSPILIFDSDTLVNNPNGYQDAFLAKYDVNGNILWSKNAGGNMHDGVNQVIMGVNNEPLIIGYFNSPTITLDSTVLTNNGSGNDLFIAKYGANGNLVWAQNCGGTGSDNGSDLSTDPNGNIFATGSFASSSISFGTNTLIKNGTSNMFVAKFNDLTAVNEAVQNKFMDIYPNPASDILKVNTQPPDFSDYSVENSLGERIAEGKINVNSEIFIGAIPNGIYFFRTGNNHRFKIIIQH